MTQDFVIGLGKDALFTAVKVGAPLMGVSLVLGVLISIFQAVTQINEASLSFVPKALAMIAVLMFAGPWMLNTLVAYMAGVFTSLPAVVR
ncbi:MAG: flagellar biosynthesis protein FliQ [Chloroflexi bacterium]|nr:flagellar biosynthesis protein FliQ [Chloroflexota bacterium]